MGKKSASDGTDKSSLYRVGQLWIIVPESQESDVVGSWIIDDFTVEFLRIWDWEE
jgi:hypothetical protein